VLEWLADLDCSIPKYESAKHMDTTPDNEVPSVTNQVRNGLVIRPQ
jgi:hypothetical protein